MSATSSDRSAEAARTGSQAVPGTRAFRSAVALAFATGFIIMGHRSGFGVLYPAVVAEEGWTVGEVTGALSVAMLIYSPAAVATGFFVDRVGVLLTMLLGSLLFGGGLIAVGLITESWQMYPLYAVAVGLGSNAVGFIAILKMLSLRAGPRLGWAMGMFNVGQGIGSLVATPALLEVIRVGGWRAGFFSLGAATLLLLLPLVLVGAPGRMESRGGQTPAEAGPQPRLWQQPVFWIVLGINAAIGYLLLLPAHQVAHLLVAGVSDRLAAVAGGMMGACIGLGALFGGWAADRWGTRQLGLAGAAGLVVGVLALLVSGPETVWLLPVYVLAGGIGRGVLGVSAAALQGRAFAGPTLGRVTGILDLGFGVGAFAGPQLVATAYEVTGSYIPGLATAILTGVLAALGVTVASAKATRSPGR